MQNFVNGEIVWRELVDKIWQLSAVRVGKWWIWQVVVNPVCVKYRPVWFPLPDFHLSILYRCSMLCSVHLIQGCSWWCLGFIQATPPSLPSISNCWTPQIMSFKSHKAISLYACQIIVGRKSSNFMWLWSQAMCQCLF